VFVSETDSDTELDTDSDLFDGDEPPTLSLAPRERPLTTWRLRWVLGVFVLVVVAALTVGIIVFNSASPERARGAASPTAATRTFLAAINQGNGATAAAISCTSFGDEARAAARSGKDPGISFTLVQVTPRGNDHATAEFAQHIKVGGTIQNTPYRIALLRGSSLWLVCGRA
jgi:hypothetical protein